MTDLSRRGLLLGLGALVAAPAIVRATSLMPVKAGPEIMLDGFQLNITEAAREAQSMLNYLRTAVYLQKNQMWLRSEFEGAGCEVIEIGMLPT